jgi:hypothetical protein
MVFEVRGIGIAKPLSEPIANNNNKSIAKPNSRADTGSQIARCV